MEILVLYFSEEAVKVLSFLFSSSVPSVPSAFTEIRLLILSLGALLLNLIPRFLIIICGLCNFFCSFSF